MIASEQSLRLAVRNVALWGDTDVLPFPIENHWFHDAEDDIVNLLMSLDRAFSEWLSSYPLIFDRVLASVGYVGFRGVTQVDAIWNAYLLGLAIEIGPDIERTRIAISGEQVFSYRFAPDASQNTLFDTAIGWRAFHNRVLERTTEFSHVVSTDISDFYPRVYHHRIENAMGLATSNKEAAKRIKILLSNLAIGGVSYGLPVGGNTARLLAELLLNRSDRLLAQAKVPFCRFVDDYYLFATSEEQARHHLLVLSEILLTHEGLTLQRNKTRIMSAEEAARSSPVAEPDIGDSDVEMQTRHFLKLRLLYDPYSPTADEDYERLKSELGRFDVVGMLGREVRKSRIDEVLVRQLVKSLRFLDDDLRNAAVESLIANLKVLYPVFPTIALVIKNLLPELSHPVRKTLFQTLRSLIAQESYIVMVPAHLSFALRLLVEDPLEETNDVLARLFNRTSTSLRRDLILAMGRRRVEHWVADIFRSTATLGEWELRALIPASYFLGDEGRYWRERVKHQLSPVNKAFLAWVGQKNDGRLWELPL